MRKTFTLLLAGAAIAAASGAAMASDVRFSVSLGVPGPVIYAPPVVVAPGPVYDPPRVVYAPAPAYSYPYYPPRVVYGPRVVVAPWWAYRHGYGRYWDHERHEHERYEHEHRRW